VGSLLAVGAVCGLGGLLAGAESKERATLKGHARGVASVAFSSDGKTLAAVDGEGVKLWTVATGKLKAILKGSGWSVAFAPDGKALALGGGGPLGGVREKEVKLWSVTDGKVKSILRKKERWAQGVAFSPDSKTLAIGGEDAKVHLWDVATGKVIATFEEQAKEKEPPGWGLPLGNTCVAFSPDGKVLASAGIVLLWGRVMLWDVATGKQKARLNKAAECLAFSPNGKVLATTVLQGAVILWDVATGKEKTTIWAGRGVSSVAFSPDGQVLASAGSEKTVQLWDVRTGKQIGTLRGHTASVIAVAFSPDGKTIASGSMDGTVKLWETSPVKKAGK
jgi:WD40 repeat protein